MNTKSSDYDDYLSLVHSKLQTDDEVIQDVVKEATGQRFFEKKRIIAGEVNEVYDVTLQDNSHIIVRISHKNDKNLDKEVWAIDESRKVGVPVPHVIAVKHSKYKGKDLTFSLLKKVTGELLERGNIHYDQLDKDHFKRIIVLSGEILSKIHSVKTVGFGYLDQNGKGNYKTLSEFILKNAVEEKEFVSLSKRTNFDTKKMKTILKILLDHDSLYQNQLPCLCHGDFAPKHILFDHEVITGIIDWQDALSHIPIYDFARWDYWFGKSIPVSWLQEGYTNKKIFDHDFDKLLHLIKLDKGLEVLSWYDKQKYPPHIERAKKQLLEDLHYFA